MTRDERRAGLNRLTATRLRTMYRAGIRTPEGRVVEYLEGAKPLHRWTKEELINTILAAEFPDP
ncbi:MULTISPECIES: hypothetical protein [unclassified Nocardia]|uniref:hypothetical protein n=1 Tax=unclassified Nocardia TaxID=2637762 RepID=UPI001CE3CC5E|nr:MULTISPECIES: hypothetical protein [unclassified Nocardia]